MSIPRVYVPEAGQADLVLELTDGEARHLTRVLRLQGGAPVRVFDGRGHEFAARIESTDRVVTVRTLEALAPAPEPHVRLTLAQALLKGRAVDAVVRNATMLGATAIQPVLTDRANVSAGAAMRGGIVERWHKIAVSSAKQCRRAVVPDVRPPVRFEQFLADTTTSLRVLLIEPRADAKRSDLAALADRPAPDSATLAIGPEGGWTQAEIDAATNQGFTTLTLGARTLRADAAPVAAISVLQFVWGDL